MPLGPACKTASTLRTARGASYIIAWASRKSTQSRRRKTPPDPSRRMNLLLSYPPFQLRASAPRIPWITSLPTKCKAPPVQPEPRPFLGAGSHQLDRPPDQVGERIHAGQYCSHRMGWQHRHALNPRQAEPLHAATTHLAWCRWNSGENKRPDKHESNASVRSKAFLGAAATGTPERPR